jgi:hypothetical protein
LLPAHDLVKIEIDHSRPAAETGLAQHGVGIIEAFRHGFFGKYRFAEFKRAHGDLWLQGRHGGDGDRLHGVIFQQSAPVTVRSWHIGSASEFSRAHGIATGKCNHLAARIGAERGKLNGAPKIAAYDAYADHGSQSLQKL